MFKKTINIDNYGIYILTESSVSDAKGISPLIFTQSCSLTLTLYKYHDEALVCVDDSGCIGKFWRRGPIVKAISHTLFPSPFSFFSFLLPLTDLPEASLGIFVTATISPLATNKLARSVRKWVLAWRFQIDIPLTCLACLLGQNQSSVLEF